MLRDLGSADPAGGVATRVGTVREHCDLLVVRAPPTAHAESLLEDLDGAGAWGLHTMYGIHGIDDNPTLHPYAREDLLCARCSANADCGGVGGSCVTIGASGRRCAAACTDDSGCPTGYACKKIASASSSTIHASMCVPEGNVCR